MNKLVYIFFLIACWSARAQTPVFRLQETKDLGDRRMTAVFQDSKGWLWFGADQGLYRYDGLAFQPVELPDSVADEVSALYEWDGRLWVGFEHGAIGFISLNSTFMPSDFGHKQFAARLQWWAPEEGLPQKTITAFASDSTGALWIATYGEGLYCYKNKRLFQFNASDDGLGSDEIYGLARDAKNRIWAATDNGISICTMPAPGKKQVERLGIAEGLPDEIATALAADKQGNIWIGTHEAGVCHYHVGQQKFDFKSGNWAFGAVLNIEMFGSNELWTGTEAGGLVRFNVRTGTAQPLPAGQSLRQARIRALKKDREGLLWILSEKGEVYSSNVRFGMLHASFDNALAVLVDRRSRLWAGREDGLFLLENGRERPVLLQKGPAARVNVIALWESPLDGNIWAGTFDNGVFVVSPEGKVIRQLSTRNGLQDNNVLSIAGDQRRVWLATFGGVTTLDLQTQQCTRLDEIGNGYVYKVFLDSKGRVWFGTDGAGLIVSENGRFRTFTEANGKTLKTIYSIAEDLRGQIWFTTDKDGLFRFDGAQFFRYDTENHLHGMAFSGLAADGNGHIVIAYEDGVDVLDPDRTDHVTFCDGAIGAPQVEVNLNALCRDAQGDVWLGARQGIMRIAAFDEVFIDDPQPGITAVSIFSETIDFLTTHTFPHDQNYFFFNFTGLWYTDPESVRYRYKLDGVDLDWKVSKDHLASYPNLRPGSYTFRVQTSEHGNFDKVPETTWSFVIDSPVWARWWFIALCLIAAGGLFYFFIHSRDERLRREAQLKRENVESQFETLKSQINPHFLFNSFNTLITIIEENPKVAVEYVEHLSDFYRSIIAYRERDFISIQEEMDLVHSFDFLLKKRYEDGFHLIDRLNGRKGLIMPLALQLLVENAVKHNIISASKPLTIEIFADENDYVVVRNNIQPKIKPEPSTHFGLQSLVSRYQLMGERPVIVEDNVAFFTVKVPIVPAAPDA